MGKVSFRAPVIPHVGADREVLGEEITVLGKTFKYWAATVTPREWDDAML